MRLAANGRAKSVSSRVCGLRLSELACLDALRRGLALASGVENGAGEQAQSSSIEAVVQGGPHPCPRAGSGVAERAWRLGEARGGALDGSRASGRRAGVNKAAQAQVFLHDAHEPEPRATGQQRAAGARGSIPGITCRPEAAAVIGRGWIGQG